jgi:hypothetical protein
MNTAELINMETLTYFGWGLIAAGLICLLLLLNHWKKTSSDQRMKQSVEKRDRLLLQESPGTTFHDWAGLCLIVGVVTVGLGMIFLLVRFIHWAWYL